METSTKLGGQCVDQGKVLLILVGGILNVMIMPIVNQRGEWVPQLHLLLGYKKLGIK